MFPVMLPHHAVTRDCPARDLASAASGSPVRIIGKYIGPLSLNNVTLEQPFLVSDNLSHDVIIGLDYLYAARAVIDFGEDSFSLTVNGVSVKTRPPCALPGCNFCSNENTPSPPPPSPAERARLHEIDPLSVYSTHRRVFTADTVIIPPKEYLTFPVYVTPLPFDEPLRFYPAPSLLDILGIESATIVMAPSDGAITFYNGSANDLVLTPDMRIGRLVPLSVRCPRRDEPTAVPDQPARDPELADQMELHVPPPPKPPDPGRKFNFHVNPDLDPYLRGRVLNLLEEFSDIFAESYADMKRRCCFTVSLPMKDDAPVSFVPPYPLNARELEFARDHVQKLVDAGVCERGSSPHNNPIMILPKPKAHADEPTKFRFILNMKGQNEHMKRINYVLPKATDLLHNLKFYRYYVKADAKDGFYQLSLDEKSRKRCSFMVGHEKFNLTRLAMGARCSVALFTHALTTMLESILYVKPAYLYVDDLFLAGNDPDELLELCREVFLRFRSHGMYLSVAKSEFFTNQVECLGTIISYGEYRRNPSRFRALEQLTRVRSPKGAKRTLAFLSYHRRFVKSFSDKTKPLHDVANGIVPFTWTAEHVQIVRDIYQSIVDATLVHFDPSLPIKAETDASLTGLSMCLYVKKDGIYRPYAYWSRLTTAPERKLLPFYLEVLAAAEGVTHFSHELRGVPFTLVTDCSSLTAIFRMKAPGPKLARCIACLGEYDITFKYRKGSLNCAADSLSRAPDPLSPPSLPHGPCPALPDDALVSTAVASEGPVIAGLAEEQAKDPALTVLRAALHAGDTSSRAARRFQLCEDGAVRTREVHPRPLIPSHLRTQVLSDSHDSVFGGHFGITKTLSRLAPFYWDTMRRDATEYVRSCEDCQRRKDQGQKQGELTPITARHPQDLVSVDYKYCPTATTGEKYLLVFVDNYTHYARAYPTKTLTTSEFLDCLRKYIFTFGCIRTILSDAGSSFIAKDYRILARSLNTRIAYSPLYFHSTSGLSESLIKSISHRLAAFCQDGLSHWPRLVDAACFAVNTSKRLTMSVSPHEMLMGYDPLVPATMTLCLPKVIPKAEKLTKHFELRTRAEEHLRRAQEAQKRFFDSKRRQTHYSVGQRVLVFRRQTGRNAKFFYKFIGPFVVKRQTGKSSYLVRVRVRNRLKLRKYHVSQMRPYFRRTKRLRPPPLVPQMHLIHVHGSVLDAPLWMPIVHAVSLDGVLVTMAAFLAHVAPMFVRACALLLLVRAASAVMSFDCSRKSLNISAISLLGPEDCPGPDEIPPPQLQEVQILQRTLYYKVPVRTCRVELEIRIYSCRATNTQHGEVNGGHDAHVHWVTPGACKQMHDRGTASIYGNPISGLRVNEETNRWLLIRGAFGRDANCHGMDWSYNGVAYEKVAAAGNARIVLRTFDARVDVASKTLHLPSGVTCDLSKGDCRDTTEGNVVWDPKPPATCSQDELDVLYTGPANITTIDKQAHTSYLTVATTARLTALIIKTDDPFTICDVTAYLTNEPRVIVLFKGKGPFPFETRKIATDNVDFLFYINSKALFLEWTAYNRLNASVAHAVHEHCLLERARLEELLLLARLSPDPAAKLMKNSVGFTALERGNVLYIAQCEARNLRLRVDTKCWHQIPVWDGPTPAFLEPSTRIIVPAATEVDCSSILRPLHWIDYQWVAFTPNITNASSVPVQRLRPTASTPVILPLVDFVGSAGAYDSEVMRDLQTAFQFPAVRSAIFNDIARRAAQTHSGPGTYGPADLINGLDIGQLTDSLLTRFFSFAATFGSYTSIFVTLCIITFAIRSVAESIVYGRLLAGVFGLRQGNPRHHMDFPRPGVPDTARQRCADACLVAMHEECASGAINITERNGAPRYLRLPASIEGRYLIQLHGVVKADDDESATFRLCAHCHESTTWVEAYCGCLGPLPDAPQREIVYNINVRRDAGTGPVTVNLPALLPRGAEPVTVEPQVVVAPPPPPNYAASQHAYGYGTSAEQQWRAVLLRSMTEADVADPSRYAKPNRQILADPLQYTRYFAPRDVTRAATLQTIRLPSTAPSGVRVHTARPGPAHRESTE
ncbi:Transposon Ty3-G Gag-Pol polyprotein [Frankliniella fusca]|uniref:RNA-directed DNA polymerase n=1 Tax=Frankliniella fusca TaxID=407009 RepID=A0AAE1HJZ7_9NEOP|nr:Transposon Ty3-G Gag-Pol polyprotein [Frankliniella fusca]